MLSLIATEVQPVAFCYLHRLSPRESFSLHELPARHSLGGPSARENDERVFTYSHITDMVFHMKTTLNIDNTVMSRLRREAARQDKTMSELVEAALRLLFHVRKRPGKKKLPPLP